MKYITHDKECDAVYVYTTEIVSTQVHKTQTVFQKDGVLVNVHFNVDGEVLGVEII